MIKINREKLKRWSYTIITLVVIVMAIVAIRITYNFLTFNLNASLILDTTQAERQFLKLDLTNAKKVEEYFAKIKPPTPIVSETDLSDPLP